MPNTYSKKLKFNSFQKAFLFIYFFTVFSGAIRKWIIPSREIGNIILLIQLLTPYCLVFIRDGLTGWRYVNKFFVILVLVLLIGVFNPINKTIYHGIIGFILHFGFFFMLLFYINNREKFKFEKILPILVNIGFLQLLISFFQYSQPDDSFINTYADLEAVAGSIAKVGQSVRVSGTFSYISGFTAYLFFHIMLVWALVKNGYKNYSTIILLFFGLIACLMSGARSATYLYLIFSVYIFFVEFRDLRNMAINRRIFFPALIILVILIGTGNKSIQNTISQAYDNFTERRVGLQQSGEEKQRIFIELQQFFNFRGNHPFAGVGLGATYQGAVRLFGISPEVEAYGFYESEQERIILEGGFLLFFTRILLIIGLLRMLYIPVFAKIIFAFLLIFFMPIVFNIYNSIFVAIGIMIVDYFYFFGKQRIFRKYKMN